jgi:adenylate cyclase
MANEIERKFRVDPQWTPPGEGTLLEQGYLSSQPERTVRVRVDGTTAKLTIKGITTGVTRAEYEYAIPFDDATAMLRDLCERPHIAKRRHVVMHAGKRWEVDVFLADNAGLVIAELELADEAEAFERPPWLREEVSNDPRYYNSNLIKQPYSTW